MTGTDVDLYGDYTGLEGLKDFDASRMVIPRLTIDHKKVCFTDSLTNVEYPGSMRMIILGMVFQRLLWHTKLGDKGELPMCKSTDGEHGYPTPGDLLPREKRFPWSDKPEGPVIPAADSGFVSTDYPPDVNGQSVLPCANCQLKSWGSHPMGQKPYCGEMYTFPVMYQPLDTEEDTLLPALFAVRSTGLKPANKYITRFVSTKTPLFTVWTEVGLDVVTSGGNDYCKPAFTSREPTERSDWPEFAKTFVGVAEAIRRPPTRAEDLESEVEVSTDTVPAAAAPQKSAPAKPKAEPPVTESTEATIDDDDLPF